MFLYMDIENVCKSASPPGAVRLSIPIYFSALLAKNYTETLYNMRNFSKNGSMHFSLSTIVFEKFANKVFFAQTPLLYQICSKQIQIRNPEG